MADAQATSTTPANAAPPPASASAGTTEQGNGGSTTPPAPTAGQTAAGTSSAATTQPGSTTTPPAATTTPPGADGAQLKVPEGLQVDEKTLTGFKDLAQGLGLKGEGAQKLLDLHASELKRAQEAAGEAKKAQYQQWLDEAKADPEIGGAKWDASLATAQRALVRFGGEKLLKALDEAGVGNHPELIRAFVKAGTAIAEDTTAGTSSQAVVTDEAAQLQKQYPSMFQKKA
jgi:hypothetical protein